MSSLTRTIRRKLKRPHKQSAKAWLWLRRRDENANK